MKRTSDPHCRDIDAARDLLAFNPQHFRFILDDPVQRERFAAEFPSARTMFEEYLEATQPTFPEFPSDGVTALQFTVFDNGPQPNVSNGRALTMKSQFGLHVKAWDRLKIDWGKAHHVAWEASACLRNAKEALRMADGLIGRELLAESVGIALEELRDATSGEGLYGICHQRKPGKGSRWTEVLIYVRWDGVGLPEKAFLIRPDFTGYEAAMFVQRTATGAPLGGRAVAQARLAFTDRLAGWATEIHA
jgi:hypothetical protein